MAKPDPKYPLATAHDVRKALEDIWSDLQAARSAAHFLLNELEEDLAWGHNQKAKHPNDALTLFRNIDTLSARTWLIGTMSDGLEEADQRLSFLVNNMPDELPRVKP